MNYNIKENEISVIGLWVSYAPMTLALDHNPQLYEETGA
jgi:hypothetical protein